MSATPDQARTRVLSFLQAQRTPVVALEDDDARGVRLLEASSGKSLRFSWDALALVEEKSTRDHPQPYLLLVFHDGRQVALADVGFAFAPATHNSGPLPELPATMCFRDFATLTAGVASLLGQGGREPEAVRAILAAIALVDGARASGFEVSGEERALEALLKALEQRGL